MSGRKGPGGAPWRVLAALAGVVVCLGAVSLISASAAGLTVVTGPAPVLMHVDTHQGPLKSRSAAPSATATVCPSDSSSASSDPSSTPDPTESAVLADCVEPTSSESASADPTVTPPVEPTPEATVEPSPIVSVEPTPEATVDPTEEPTVEPTIAPSA